jgi:hypothetical protein
MTCKWIGEGEGCDRQALEGRHYCDTHLWKVYQKGTNLAKRKKDIRVAESVWDIENEFNLAVQELIEEGFEL